MAVTRTQLTTRTALIEADHVSKSFPSADGSTLHVLDDVSLTSAGLIPFGENDPDAAHLKFAHRSRIVDHAEERGLAGLLTLIGVRYTTGPVEAVEAIDLVCRRLGRSAPASRLEVTPVHGGDFADFEALVRDCLERGAGRIGPELARALAHRHGTAATVLLDMVARNPDEAQVLGEGLALAAEISYAVTHEMAMTLADALFRRTDLCTLGHPGEAALRAAARVMGRTMGWTEARCQIELDDVRRRLRRALAGRALLADAAPEHAAVA